MAVLDRMHRRQMEQREQTAEGSPGTGLSIIRADRPDVIKRLEVVVSTLHGYVRDNDDSGTMARFSFVAEAMIQEVSEELADRDEETLRAFMEQMGEVIAWIGHGDSERLPETMRAFV